MLCHGEDREMSASEVVVVAEETEEAISSATDRRFLARSHGEITHPTLISAPLLILDTCSLRPPHSPRRHQQKSPYTGHVANISRSALGAAPGDYAAARPPQPLRRALPRQPLVLLFRCALSLRASLHIRLAQGGESEGGLFAMCALAQRWMGRLRWSSCSGRSVPVPT